MAKLDKYTQNVFVKRICLKFFKFFNDKGMIVTVKALNKKN